MNKLFENSTLKRFTVKTKFKTKKDQIKYLEKNEHLKVWAIKFVKVEEEEDKFLEYLFDYIDQKKIENKEIKILTFKEPISPQFIEKLAFFVRNRNDTLILIKFQDLRDFDVQSDPFKTFLNENRNPEISHRRLLSPVDWSIEEIRLLSPSFRQSCISILLSLKAKAYKIPKFLIFKILQSY